MRFSHLALIAVFLICGCSKKEVVAPVCYLSTVDVPPYQDRYTYTNGKWTGGFDNQLGVYSVVYDQKDRVAKLLYQRDTVTNYYDANDRLINVIQTNVFGVYDSITYGYNSYGQLATKSEIIHIVPVDSLFSEYFYPNTTTRNPASVRLKFVVSKDLYSFNYFTYEYDNKVNPYLSIKPYDPELTANNVTNILTTGSSYSSTQGTVTGGSANYNYRYTYTSNGYPLSSTLIEPNNTSTYPFTYTNCN